MRQAAEALRTRFDAAIRNSPLSPHRDYLLRVLRPVIWIVRASEPPRTAQSKLGGWPDLPPNASWPEHSGGPHVFIAQFNLAELEAEHVGLPRHGMLSFFAATTPFNHVFWRDAGYVRALYSESTLELVATEPPPPSMLQRAELEEFERFTRELQERYEKEVAAGTRSPEEPEIRVPTRERRFAVTFVSGLDFPRSIDQRSDWPVSSDPAELRAFFDAATSLWQSVASAETPDTRDHLFGYPGVSSLGYDPTPSADHLHLLCLSSHGELEWCWHDGDYLHVSIEVERLRRGDFSELASDAG